MAYCSQDDILKMIPEVELAQLTAESGDIPDSGVVAEAIIRADAEIDVYLGSCYQVPLSPVPESIKSVSIDLAIFHLYGRRSVVPAVRMQRYEAALALLRHVAAGQAVIVGADGQMRGTPRDVVGFVSAPRLFSRDSLWEW
jgi:phage gp36-like protein